MPSENQKNYALTPAGVDLGLGDLLTDQMKQQEDDRKKKLLALARSESGVAGFELLGG